ncbi:MAG: type I restriction endonuclease [Candidatus Omnitrophota bacterium]
MPRVDNDESFHRLLTDDIEVEYLLEHSVKGDKVWLVDFDDVHNNEFVICNQFTRLLDSQAQQARLHRGCSR